MIGIPAPLQKPAVGANQAIVRSSAQWSPCGQYVVVSQEMLAEVHHGHALHVSGLIWDVAP